MIHHFDGAIFFLVSGSEESKGRESAESEFFLVAVTPYRVIRATERAMDNLRRAFCRWTNRGKGHCLLEVEWISKARVATVYVRSFFTCYTTDMLEQCIL